MQSIALAGGEPPELFGYFLVTKSNPRRGKFYLFSPSFLAPQQIQPLPDLFTNKEIPRATMSTGQIIPQTPTGNQPKFWAKKAKPKITKNNPNNIDFFINN
jgi:hypothetical protein